MLCAEDSDGGDQREETFPSVAHPPQICKPQGRSQSLRAPTRSPRSTAASTPWGENEQRWETGQAVF